MSDISCKSCKPQFTNHLPTTLITELMQKNAYYRLCKCKKKDLNHCNVKMTGHHWLNRPVRMNDSAETLNDGKEDANLDNLYPALIECFTIILCGYTAGRLNLISQQESKGLNVFVSSFSLPSLIFLSLAQLDLSSVNWSFLASILISKAIVFIGVILITFFLNRPVHLGKLGIYAVFCTQSNDFAIGYPILSAIYGQYHPEYPAYLYLLAPISLAILNPVAFVLMELGKRQGIDDKEGRILTSSENITESKLDGSENGGVVVNSESPSRLPRSSNLEPVPEENENNSSNRSGYNRESHLKFFSAILKGIITNPVIFMTILGLIGNSFIKYVDFAIGILKVLGSAFSATALFVLGLRMVGTVQKFKGDYLVVPGILIIIKLLVLPLVTREVVSVLQPGKTPDETLDLSTFGFLYGTFPTAPAVFVFALQYNLEIDVVSSSMVACTFISAPLMFVTAKMIFLDSSEPDNYFKELQNFKWDLAIVGVAVGAWMVILFAINKAYSKLPHKATASLIFAQIIICIAVLLEPVNDRFKPWSVYAQFSLFLFGIYSSRIWSTLLAIILVLLQSRSLCYVLKLMPFFMTLGWVVPGILAAIACHKVKVADSGLSEQNPNFLFGSFEAAVSLTVLIVCVFVTGGALVLQHRFQRRSAKFLSLVKDVNSRDLEEVTGLDDAGDARATSSSSKTRLIDIEEIGATGRREEYIDYCSLSGCDNDICSSRFHCTEEQREVCEINVKQYNDQVKSEEVETESDDDQQVLRHIVLLILIVTSMFVGIMLCIWTLVVADAFSGIYLELAFLDVTLNIGQICLTFAVFGLDARRALALIANWWRKFHYGADTIVLTPVEKLSFETTHVCHQFIAHHLKNCEADIARHKRLRLKLYKDCFKGKDLVSWLEEKRLAKDAEEAIQYASHLLEGRVLRHVESRHHFSNSNLLYTFRN